MKNLMFSTSFVFSALCTMIGGTLYAQGLYPDLQTVVPIQLQIQNAHQQEILRFSNGIANTGDGDFRLRPEFPDPNSNLPQLAYQQILDEDRNVVLEELVGEYEFHEEHNHWHINNVALFEVHAGSPDGPVYGSGTIKVTFCLIDWYNMDGNSPNNQRIYSECNAGFQGIQPGWVDQYHQATEGQQLNITDAPEGLYYLVSTVNPDLAFIELDYTNNTAWTSFLVSRHSNGNMKIKVTGHSPCATDALCGIGVPNR